MDRLDKMKVRNKTTYQNAIFMVDNAVAMWPNIIDVRNKTLFLSGSARIDNLEVTRELIENETPDSSEGALYISIHWSIYTLLHKIARATNVIRPHDLSKLSILEYLKKHFHWEIEGN